MAPRPGDRAGRHDHPCARRARGGRAVGGRGADEADAAPLRRAAVDGRAALAVGAADVLSERCAARSTARPSCASCSSTTASRGRCGRCSARSAGPSNDLPDPARLIDEVDNVDAVLRDSTADGIDGAELDDAMDELQHRDRPARPADPRPLPSARRLAPRAASRAPPTESSLAMPLTHHAVLERLVRDRTALIRRQAEADRVIAASGAGHLVHEMNVRPDEAGGRPWRIDPVPLVLDGATFDRLADAASPSALSRSSGPRRPLRPAAARARRRRARRGAQREPRYRVGTVGTPEPASLAHDVRRRRGRARRRHVADRPGPHRRADRARATRCSTGRRCSASPTRSSVRRTPSTTMPAVSRR